jgi:hypothetical protein
MDYTQSSVLALLRGPLLSTPQGWCVVLTAVAYWLWAAIMALTGAHWPFKHGTGQGIAGLIFWPLLMFLLYVRMCMPEFQASWSKAAQLVVAALSLPVAAALVNR